MANLTIKNIPDDVPKKLKSVAAEQGRSLNSLIVRLLENEAELWCRRKRMRASWDDLQKFVASLPPMGESAELLREDRERDE